MKILPEAYGPAIDINNPLPVKESGVTTAYGDQSMAEPTPIIQVEFSYGINPRELSTEINEALGSTSTSHGLATCSTGATADSHVVIQSRIPAEYQPGTGIANKFSGMFSVPAVGSIQRIGIGNPEDGYFFNYIDEEFSVTVLHGGIRELAKFVITSGATSDGDITITLNGDAKTVAVINGDTVYDIARKIESEPSWSLLGDGWNVFIQGDTVRFRSFLAIEMAGAVTYGAGVTGSAATVTEELDGLTPEITSIAQADWNNDKMDSTGPSGMTIDHTKLNVFKIQFQYLGAGAIEYFIESDTTGDYVLVHRINYVNKNTAPSIHNPSLPVFMMAMNIANDTDIQVHSSSMGLFSQGKVSNKGIIFSVGGDQTVTTEEIVFALNLPPIFNGVPSRVVAKPITLSLVADGTKPVKFRVYRDPIINDSPVFAELAPTISPMAFTTTPNTTATGIELTSFTLAKENAQTFDLTVFGIEGVTGSGFAVTAESASSSVVSASLAYKEFQ